MITSGDRICILDPASHIPSLKTIFQEADYYAHEPDSRFHFNTTQHYTKQQIYDTHGFYYLTEFSNITSTNYDILFIVAPLKDYFSSISADFSSRLKYMRDLIETITQIHAFKKIALFDVYDYDYDPSIINTKWKVDIYFKRNYQINKSYASNVYPFPFIMFVKPCVLGMCLSPRRSSYTVNRAFWCGGLYNHSDGEIHRNRLSMYNKIASHIDTFGSCNYEDYLNLCKTYKIGVDLIGVGDPNKRTIELLCSGTLMLSMCKYLAWGFEDADCFHPDTFFETADEFISKLHRLLNDEDHYKTCLARQNYIVEKYFNKDWFKKYITIKLK